MQMIPRAVLLLATHLDFSNQIAMPFLINDLCRRYNPRVWSINYSWISNISEVSRTNETVEATSDFTLSY